MIQILTIIGARPQIIKAAALSRAIKTHFAGQVVEKILHTGQHYDANMSQVFFEELGIPEPHYNLHVGSGAHGEQTAKMIAGIEQVLQQEHFDALVVYGDTNSTLAGAVAAAKLLIPVFHIEAGLRSFNMTMPEEQNRIVCDHLSSLLFAPTQTAMDNLQHEGVQKEQIHFAGGKKRKVLNCGDLMYDNSLYFAELAAKQSTVLRYYDLHPQEYVLATIHRDNNTDSAVRLTAIFTALLQVAREIQVVLPLHPRTAKLLEKNLAPEVYQAVKESNILFLPPVSFLDMILLEKHARIVMTDSGGVQKESFFFKKPCVIFRPETEWVEIVEQGAAMLADADTARILHAFKHLMQAELQFPAIFGDGHAAEYMVRAMIDYVQ